MVARSLVGTGITLLSFKMVMKIHLKRRTKNTKVTVQSQWGESAWKTINIIRGQWSKHVAGKMGQRNRNRQENSCQFSSTPITHTISSNKHAGGERYSPLAAERFWRPPLPMHQTHMQAGKSQTLFWHLFKHVLDSIPFSLQYMQPHEKSNSE